ncbi:MAG: hypothetical protein ABL878_17710, partial [Burkholderiales bacterium]
MIGLIILYGAILNNLSYPTLNDYRNSARILSKRMSKRRPAIGEIIPIYYEKRVAVARSRQGTAFNLDLHGDWATAAHVTDQCSTIRFIVSQHL